MKIIFFGNADFGLEALAALIKSPKHSVLAIVVNPDKKINRNKKNKVNPIKQIGLDNNISIIEQDDISSKNFISKLKAFNADIFLVIAYKVIPESVYTIPRYGAVNLHASILPEYRGAAPIQRALINGDECTGLSTFFINDKIDRGKLIFQKEVPIYSDDSFYDLWLRLSQKGPETIFNTLDLVEKGETALISSRKVSSSYAPKIDKKELYIDWHEDSLLLHNKIRAFSPYPCMYTYYKKVRFKIVSSNLATDELDGNTSLAATFKFLDSGPPGSIYVIDGYRLCVECGVGFLEILELKPESKKTMYAKDFINGFISKADSKEINIFE